MIPPEILEPLAAFGLPGTIIGLLIWALVRKDKQVETLQEARVLDQKERAADNLRAAEIIEKLNQAARQREEASDSRWRITEGIVGLVKEGLKINENTQAEVIRIGRSIDANTIRQEQRIDDRRGGKP